MIGNRQCESTSGQETSKIIKNIGDWEKFIDLLMRIFHVTAK